MARLHGRMPADDKDRTMRAFAAGEIDVLVSTTVIEVGVDVANATTMVILDADRFGVSQLHQLRGRVGRGGHPGLCLLVTRAEAETPGRARLDAVAATTDGFELSRIDLEQRREGDVLGASQSGRRSSLQNLRVLRDEETIVAAREAAERLLDADPDLGGAPRPRGRGRGPGDLGRVRLHGEVVTRIIGGTAGGRRLTTPRGHRHPADQRPGARGAVLRRGVLVRVPARGSASSTCTPAPGRSASRPGPAAPGW